MNLLYKKSDVNDFFFNFLNPSKINTSVNLLHRLETKKIIMNIKEKIQATTTFKELTKKTSFLKKILLNQNTTESIERIIYQIEKLGEDYVADKNYLDR